MYRVSKRMEISAMHQLKLDYESPCTNIHGHNWYITVEIEGDKLNKEGMLIDFTVIKKLIHDKLDHKNLNEVLDFNPTAENIASWVSSQINSYINETVWPLPIRCNKVRVEETQGNYAEWERGMIDA